MLTRADGAELRTLVALLRVGEVVEVACACGARAELEFRDGGGEVLALVQVHPGGHLRWSGWVGVGFPADRAGLRDWFAAHGLPELGEEDARREAAARRGQELAWSWVAAAPAILRPLAQRLVTSGGEEPDDGEAEAARLLATDVRDDVERCRELLRWYAAGTGASTAYPLYEEIPGRLVEAMPLDAVLAALAGEPADGEVWAGALRHLAGRNTRTAKQLRRVPDDVWAGLIDLAQRRDDSARRARLERMRERYRSGS